MNENLKKYGSVKFLATPFLGIPIGVWLGGFLIIIIIAFYTQIKAFITGLFAVSNTTADILDYQKSGNTAIEVTSINPAQKARFAYDAIWGGIFGFFEDEDAFVEAIISVPKEYIDKVAIEYAKIDNKGKNLYNDAKKYLRDSQYLKIQHLLS